MKRICVTDANQLQQLAKYFADAPDLYIDFETGWDPPSGYIEGAGVNWYLEPKYCHPVGITICPYDGEAYYFPWGHVTMSGAYQLTNDGQAQLSKELIVSTLKPLLEEKPCSAHNGKFDIKAARSLGIKLNLVHDSMLLVFSAGVGYEEFNEDAIVEREFHYKKTKYDQLFAPKTPKSKKNFATVTLDVATDYTCDDGIWGRRINTKYIPLVANQPTSRGVGFIYNLEMKLLPVVIDIEDQGMPVDIAYFRSENAKLKEAANRTEQIIFDQITEMVKLRAEQQGSDAPIGRIEFKLNSTKDLPYWLFTVLGLPVLERSEKTQAPSTAALVMQRLANKYPVCHNILAWREIEKAAKAYEEEGLERYAAADGKIHTNYRQTGATSGRFASSDPNTQNISKANEWIVLDLDGQPLFKVSTNVRDGFNLEEDEYELERDFSMVEFRIFAQLSNEQSVIQAFREGRDVHRETASTVFQISLDQVTEKHRDDGKTLNYASIYGIGPQSFAARTGISVDQAKEAIERYFASKPMFRVFGRRIQAIAAKSPLHQVETYFGRKQVVPEFFVSGPQARSKADRASVNRVVQGTAADIQKMALLRVWKAINQQWPYGEVKIFRQTHDSINFRCKRSVNPQEVIDITAPAMEIPIQGWEKLPTDCKIGLSWGDLVKEETFLKKVAENNGDWNKVFTEWDEKRRQRSTITITEITNSSLEEELPELVKPQLPKHIKVHLPRITKEQALSLKEYLTSFPGKNLFILALGENGNTKEMPLSNCPTELDEASCRSFLSELFTSCRIEVVQTEPIAELILQGVEL